MFRSPTPEVRRQLIDHVRRVLDELSNGEIMIPVKGGKGHRTPSAKDVAAEKIVDTVLAGLPGDQP